MRIDFSQVLEDLKGTPIKTEDASLTLEQVAVSALPEAGVAISAQMTAGPGVDGYALDTETITMVSGDDGVAQHTGFVRGAAYKFRRGTSAWWTAAQVAPNAATWNLREILGTP